MQRETNLFVIFPLAVNALLAVGTFLIFPAQFNESAGLCFLIAIVGTGAAAATLFGFFGFGGPQIGSGRTLSALVCHAIALIFVFAGIYRGFGLFLSANLPAAVVVRSIVPWDSALYFSIVTWTTLGYGDFAPLPPIRLVAALQALLGYSFFGLIVGLATDILVERAKRP